MPITVITPDNKEIQVEPTAIKLPDGYALVTPDSIPTGFLKQEAVDKIVGERVIHAKQKAVNDFIEDTSKHEAILSKYNIAIKDGKPVGVDSANIDELKRDITLKVRNELESEYKPSRTENRILKERVVMTELKNAAIKSGVKSDLADLAMKSFKDDFGIDTNGNVLVKDGQGFKVDASGNFVTAESYFLEKRKSDAYKSLFDTSAQSGVGAGKPGATSPNFSNVKAKSDLKTDMDRVKYIKEYGQQAYLELSNK